MSSLGTRIEDMPEVMFNWQLNDAFTSAERTNQSEYNTIIEFKTRDGKPAFAEYLEIYDEWQVFTSA